MARIFKTPFGAQGDTEQVPEAPQGDGSVSLTQGFGYDYEREYDDPAAKDIRREVMNGLFHDITEAVGDIQLSGIAKWDAAAAPYPAGAVVWHDSEAWMSTAGNNNSVPGTGGWKAVDLSSSIRLSEPIDQVPGANNVQEALAGIASLVAQPWISKPIGEPFPIFDHLSGIEIPPTNNPNFRFIKLTAGENDVGGYNDGILIGETVSGTAPLITATAEINLPDSPLHGQTVNLINTEGRYIRPGTNSGATANDQMQQITGTISIAHGDNTSPLGGGNSLTGAFVEGEYQPAGSEARMTGNSTPDRYALDFDSANSPDARTGDHTDVKHQQATYYMRIA